MQQKNLRHSSQPVKYVSVKKCTQKTLPNQVSHPTYWPNIAENCYTRTSCLNVQLPNIAENSETPGPSSLLLYISANVCQDRLVKYVLAKMWRKSLLQQDQLANYVLAKYGRKFCYIKTSQLAIQWPNVADKSATLGPPASYAVTKCGRKFCFTRTNQLVWSDQMQQSALCDQYQPAARYTGQLWQMHLLYYYNYVHCNGTNFCRLLGDTRLANSTYCICSG